MESRPPPPPDPSGDRAVVASPLTGSSLRRAADELACRDGDLRRVLRAHGVPPLWPREPGFRTILLIILEQQVSLASARAAMRRLEERIGTARPDAFLRLSDEELLRIGFSRQKREYGRGLARLVLDGRLALAELQTLPDEEARGRLLEVRGIGPWSADIYLLMALRRPDVWPAGDRALETAAWRLKGLAARPGPAELAELAAAWAPWRAVAARILWHYYLSDPVARSGRRLPRDGTSDPAR